MELFDPRHLDRIRKKLSQTLSRLQRGRSRAKSSPETLKLLKGILYLMLSCTLAWASAVSTGKMTIIEYRKTHQPHASFWRSLLVAHGFKSIQSIEERKKILRTPEAFEGGSDQVRVSPGVQTLIFPQGALGEISEVWHRGALQPASKEWSSFHINLNGIEALRELLDNPSVIPKIQVKHRTKSIDPKEIRY
ncbi:MAG: hypothetical protein KGP28_06170 [Bdellovibrionales bacterium]|nr:hypothetical protein [Bdellovibrionales bacterium]